MNGVIIDSEPFWRQAQIKILATSLSVPIINAVCSANKVTHKKPQPAIYLKAAEELNANPVNCFVLEDKTNPRFSITDVPFSAILKVINYLEATK